MSEHLPRAEDQPEDSFEDIPRRSPEIRAVLANGIEAKLNWYTTTVVFYPNEYTHMDHIQINDQEHELKGCMFGVPDHMKNLFSQDFPVLRAPEPTRDVILTYLRWQREQLPDTPEAWGAQD